MDTTKSITLGQAFAHCASTSSYWWGIFIVLALIGLAILGMVKFSQKTEINPYVKMALVFAMVAAIFLAVFMRPVDVHVNTSQAAAARGHYLGY